MRRHARQEREPLCPCFLAGIAAATDGAVRTVEDVLRLPVDAAVSDVVGTDDVDDESARGRGRGNGRRRRGGGGCGSEDLGKVKAGSPLHFVAFHGTRTEEGLRGITVGGWDPARRAGQALGPGEYFGRHPTTASGYDSLGSCVIVGLLLRVPAVVTNKHAVESVVVVNNPKDLASAAGGRTYCLPIGLYGAQAAAKVGAVNAWRAEAAAEARAAREAQEAAKQAKPLAPAKFGWWLDPVSGSDVGAALQEAEASERATVSAQEADSDEDDEAASSGSSSAAGQMLRSAMGFLKRVTGGALPARRATAPAAAMSCNGGSMSREGSM